MKSLHINIKISDPWEFGEFLNWNPLQGEILLFSKNASHGDVIIKLDNPFSYTGVLCEYFIGSPRHQGEIIYDIKKGKTILCNFIRISTEQAESQTPFDTSLWRGGIAIIGTIDIP